MKSKQFVLLGFILGVIFWLTESTIHSLVFHQGGFLQTIFPIDINETWMRSFSSIMFVCFGFVGQSLYDKKIEAEARHNSEQFKHLVDFSPEAIGIHRQGKVVYVNAAALKLLGATEAGAIIGQSVLSFVHPDDREESNKRICQTPEGGTPSYRVEEKLLRLDGEPFLAEITSIPVEFDGVPSVMLLGRDIVERKRWENELKASVKMAETAKEEADAARKREQEQARLLEKCFQYTHDCIVLLDKDFNFIRVNQAYADACKRDINEFHGHNHFELYPSSLIDDFRKVVATGIPYQSYTRPFMFPDHPEWGVTYWDFSLVPISDQNRQIELLLFTLKDVTNHRRAEISLGQTSRALRTISACDSLLVHATEETELLDAMCRMIVETGGYCLAWVGYAEDDAQKAIRLQAHAGSGVDFLAKAKFSWGEDGHNRCPTGTALRTDKTIVVHNIETAECKRWCNQAQVCGFSSSIAIPLRDSGRAYGTLSIYSNEPNVFNNEEIGLLEQLAADLSFGIGNLRSGLAHKKAESEIVAYLEQLEESMQQTLQAVSNMVEQRDPYTSGHERRVGILAADIAREMGWPDEKCRYLELIGLVHDIGKIGIPAEILSKPSRLTSLEYAIVMGHAEKGYEILKDVTFQIPIAEIIREHHERMDGSGYPRGLKGEEILPEARIIAVADVLESMSSHRPYRPALGIAAALKEIESHQGIWFDQPVVDALLRLIREKGYQIPI